MDEEEIQVWLSAGTIVNFVLNNNLTLLTKVRVGRGNSKLRN